MDLADFTCECCQPIFLSPRCDVFLCLNRSIVKKVVKCEIEFLKTLEYYFEKNIEKITHTNLVTIYLIYRYSNEVLIVMEMLDETLTSYIMFLRNSKSSVAFKEFFDILCQMVSALEFLQDSGLAHCDIKPDNIMFKDGVPKLIDLDFLSDKEHNKSGDITGTKEYFSPEIQKLSLRTIKFHNQYKSDVYSLGLTMLYLASLSDIGTISVLHNQFQRVNALDYKFNPLKPLLHSMLKENQRERPDFIILKVQLKNLQTAQVDFPLKQIIVLHCPCNACGKIKSNGKIYLLDKKIYCSSCVDLKKIAYKM